MNVAIIGAGVSGLSIALTLLKKGISVTIYEALNAPLKKLLASGNGKANLSNKYLNSNAYNNEDFASNVLNKFNNDDLIDFLKSIGVYTKFDNEGRMYPYNEIAKSVCDSLLLMAHHLGAKIIYKKVEKIEKKEKFIIFDTKYDYVALACGSVAHNGVDSYNLAKMLGHNVTKLSSSLCPIYSSDSLLNGLDGIRVKAKVYLNEFIEYGEIQFKKDALSGIVIFNLVSYLNKNNISNPTIYIDLIDGYSYDDFIKIFNNDWKYLDVCFQGLINNRLMNNILKKLNLGKRFVNELNTEEKLLIYNTLKKLPNKLDGLYDFKSAQVISGGVNLDEVDNNMRSKIIDNLYIIGEMLNIDGKCGGYNIHMAFATGAIAGEGIIDDINRKY